MTPRIGHRESWLRIACAVLLLSLGLSHKPVEAMPASWAATADALSGDAIIGQLCLDGKEGRSPALPGWHGCDTCLVVAGAILPPPPVDHVDAPSAFSTIVFPALARLDEYRDLRPGSPVRGPPVQFA